MGLALELDLHESVWIGEARVFVEKIGQSRIRVRINAPPEIPIVRDEVRKRDEFRRETEAIAARNAKRGEDA